MKVLLDTNCLMVCIPKKSKYRPVYTALLDGNFRLAVSSSVLLEYEEKLSEFYSQALAEVVMAELKTLENVENTDVYYFWNLITADPDDNKFVDCAIASGADYIVTHDRHFKELKRTSFPKINCITLDEFQKILMVSAG